MRSSVALAVIAGVLLTPIPALTAQDLKDAVPPDVWMFVHSEADPQAEVIQGYYLELAQAVMDARFDETMFDILEIGLSGEEIGKVRAFYDHFARLLEDVPWQEMGKNEFLFARAMRRKGYNMSDVLMWGMRVDPPVREKAHGSMRRLLMSIEQLDDGLQLELQVGRGDEARVYTDSAEFPAVAALAASDQAAIYRFNYETGQGDEAWTIQTGAELAFHGDYVLTGMNGQAHAQVPGLVDDAMDFLEGHRTDSLTKTERFRAAYDSLGNDGFEAFYMDFPNMFTPMFGIARDATASGDFDEIPAPVVNMLLKEAEDLVGPFSTLATKTSMRDELNMVTETSFRYEDSKRTRRSPFFQVAPDATNDSSLLEFVPADCTEFRVTDGAELRPMHDWVVERVGRYAPEGEKVLAVYEAGQAVLGVDVREELLPLLGSGYASMSLPAQRPTAFKAEDRVTVMLPKNPESAKRLHRRLARLLGATSPFVAEVNQNIQKAQKDMPFIGLMGGFKLGGFEPANAPFPGMMSFSVEVGGETLQTTFGFVGDMWVSTTSPDALMYVMETYAGEYPNIMENEGFMELVRLPEEPVLACSLADYDGMNEGILQGIEEVKKVLGMVHPFVNKESREAGQILGVVIDALPKVSKVVSHFDFLDRSANWYVMRDGGLEHYQYSVMAHKAPHERGTDMH